VPVADGTGLANGETGEEEAGDTMVDCPPPPLTEGAFERFQPAVEVEEEEEEEVDGFEVREGAEGEVEVGGEEREGPPAPVS
jgi:hypothetical protein